jgi:hypothetical protein
MSTVIGGAMLPHVHNFSPYRRRMVAHVREVAAASNRRALKPRLGSAKQPFAEFGPHPRQFSLVVGELTVRIEKRARFHSQFFFGGA